MKKLLNISVIAVLAALPMTANAAVGDILSVTGPATAASQSQAASDVTATTAPKYALAKVGANDDKVATAGYVKGAYNEAIKAINKVSDIANGALTADGEATLTHKTIDANGTGNNITNIETDNFNADAIVTSTEAIKLDGTGSDTELTTEKAVAGAITTATSGMVTETGTQTLTNKAISGGTVSGAAISGGTVSGATITGGTINADSTTISNLETDNFKDGVVRDSTDTIRASGSASDEALVTEKAVATAIEGAVTNLGMSNYATTTGAAATAENAVNGATVESTFSNGTIGNDATATGTVNSAVTGTGTATVNMPTSGTVATLTTWGNDNSTDTAAVTLATTSTTIESSVTGNATASNVSLAVTGSVTGDVATTISAGTVTYDDGE